MWENQGRELYRVRSSEQSRVRILQSRYSPDVIRIIRSSTICETRKNGVWILNVTKIFALVVKYFCDSLQLFSFGRVLTALGALCSRRFYKGYGVSGTSDLLLSPVSLDFQNRSDFRDYRAKPSACLPEEYTLFQSLKRSGQMSKSWFLLSRSYVGRDSVFPNKYRENPDEIRMVGHLFSSSSNLNLC